jgi:hypothetical protein
MSEGRRGGFGPLAAGFILAVIGFAGILYEIWTTASIPLNTVTYTFVVVAGAGVALGLVGFDRHGIRT